MTLAEEYALSLYEDVTRLVPDKDVWLVRSQEDGQFYVKKSLRQGEAGVYERIRDAAVPGIPPIFFCAKDTDRLVVVEAFIQGRTLGDVIRQGGCFSQEKALATGSSLCRVVAALHAMVPPVIHRDIKPSNVLCSNEGAVWLIDLHAARAYQPGQVQDTQLLGTPAFAAPEQYGFGQSDGRTDIYGLGVTLNYMCTGQVPKRKLAAGPLGSIVTRCTQLDPAARYQTVEELAQALEEAAAEVRRTASKAHRTASKTRRAASDTAAAASKTAPEAASSGAHASDSAPSDTPVSDTSAPKTPIPGWRRFLPVGFRSGKVWKMILAVLGYVLIAYTSFSTALTAQGIPMTGLRLRLNQTAVFLTFIGWILWGGNYLSVRDRLPGMNRSRTQTWIFGILYPVALLFLLAFLVSGLETALGYTA